MNIGAGRAWTLDYPRGGFERAQHSVAAIRTEAHYQAWRDQPESMLTLEFDSNTYSVVPNRADPALVRSCATRRPLQPCPQGDLAPLERNWPDQLGQSAHPEAAA